MIDILPGNNTTKHQLQSMLGALLGVCHKISATVQKKFQTFTSMKCQLLSISQVSCLEMLGTYSIAGVHKLSSTANVIYMTYIRYGWEA